MAISSSTRKAGPFIGNDATTVFPFAFKVFTAADLRVVNTSALGVESDLVIDVDYTVSLNADQDNDPGGSVTRLTALPTGQRLTITSDVEALQPLVLTNNGGFYPRVINDAFDKITIIAQQLIEQVGRSLKLPISSSASATLPDPVANRLIAWNSSANGFANVNPADIATVAAYADAYIDLFTGNGTQTAFTLTHDPAVLANLFVSISGVTQVGGEDFTWIGTTLTFLVAPPNGTRIQVRYTRAIPPADLASAVAAAEADRVATAADRVQTGLDRVATAADVVSAEADRVATAADRVQTGLDAVATAADRVQTGLDVAATSNKQPLDADLTAIAALTSAADKMPYATGAQTWALADLTSFARTLLATASNSAFLTALGQIASSFVSFVNSGTGAATRTLQAVLRERPVSVLDYYDAGDGADYGPAFGRALTASPRVFWPDNASGYTISSAVSKTLTRDVIVDWNGQQVTFSAAVDLAGATVADVSVTLSANPARYATSVSITGGSSSSVQAGDILNIQSSVLPFSDAPDAKQDAVRIRSVSGSGPYTLTLDAGLNFPWSSAESGIVVTIFRPVKVTHLRPNFIITETDGTGVSKYAVRHTGLRDITITSPVIKGNRPFTPSVNFYRTGFQLYYCVGWTVTDGVYEAISYPLGVYGGTRNGMEINSKARFCRHSHADMGGFASDYRLIGLHDEDSFVALSTHPAFRCYAEAFEVRNNTALTAWRCMGGSLKNGTVHTTDSTSDTPQIQSWIPNSGFEYVYDDADFDIDGVSFDNPNRTAADVYVHYGRNVRVADTAAIDIRVGSTVDLYLNGEGNRLTTGKASPQSTLILSPARVDGVAVLDAYLASSVYHIDPYRSITTQGNKTLYAKGVIFRKSSAPAARTIRIHRNAFAGLSVANYLVGRFRVKAFLTHESAGFFSVIERAYDFGLTDGTTLYFSTTAIQTIGPSTGSGGPVIDVVLSSPTLTSASGDSYVQFTLTDSIAGGSGSSNASYNMIYELELSETFAA